MQLVQVGLHPLVVRILFGVKEFVVGRLIVAVDAVGEVVGSILEWRLGFCVGGGEVGEEDCVGVCGVWVAWVGPGLDAGVDVVEEAFWVLGGIGGESEVLLGSTHANN